MLIRGKTWTCESSYLGYKPWIGVLKGLTNGRLRARLKRRWPMRKLICALLVLGCSKSSNPSSVLTVPSGFSIETIATVPGARQISAMPNGDLLVGTLGTRIYRISNIEDAPTAPALFATLPQTRAHSVFYDASTQIIFAASNQHVYTVSSSGTPTIIANVRTGPIAPTTDGDNHDSTTVVATSDLLYVSVGSSCNACPEVDPTRAVILSMNKDGSNVQTKATRIRNAIAMAVNPATGTLWAGGAGQDNLATGHPYEFFDAVTLHSGTADYGWPNCEENHTAYIPGSDCSATVEPLFSAPAYQTWIGAAFYPATQTGAHVFPAQYRGGLFLAGHGSWHVYSDTTYITAPRVAFVAMNGDAPAIAADWTDPTRQWTEFVSGWQSTDGLHRIGRPAGVAVGPQGSLFIADDDTGKIYRVRPTP